MDYVVQTRNLALYDWLHKPLSNNIFFRAYSFDVACQKSTNKNIPPFIFIVFAVTGIGKVSSFRK
jgi:hypothetical protein